MAIKRKRHTKRAATVRDLNQKKTEKAVVEEKKLKKVLKQAKKEFSKQKRLKKSAPTPIEERKELGYNATSAGLRQDLFNEWTKKKEQRRVEKKLAKENKKTKQTTAKVYNLLKEENGFRDLIFGGKA